MDLVTLRERFVKLSGRYDLVVDTVAWADNGADFYIQAAQEFLDRRSQIWKKDSRIWEEVAAGVWYSNFQLCRIIEEVYINNTTGRSRLTKKDFHWLHENWSEPISAADQGTPLYFCPARLRKQDNTDMNNLGSFYNHVADNDEAYRGIIILPPPDEAIVIEVFGKFYSAELSSDDDESYWTIENPSVLLLASLYQLEILDNNDRQAARDYLEAIDRSLIDIDKDIVEEESYGVNQIED